MMSKSKNDNQKEVLDLIGPVAVSSGLIVPVHYKLLDSALAGNDTFYFRGRQFFDGDLLSLDTCLFHSIRGAFHSRNERPMVSSRHTIRSAVVPAVLARSRRRRPSSLWLVSLVIAVTTIFWVVVSAVHLLRQSPSQRQSPTSAIAPAAKNGSFDCNDWLQSMRLLSRNTTTSTNTIHTHRTILVPGYPGSGSELFRTLITVMTGGMEAADWYLKDQDRCNRHPATCKTHCPVLNKCPTMEDDQDYYHSHAILLLRNPQQALPSRVNFMWERLEQHQMETHQHQAPEEFWKRTRNDKFGRLLGGWKRLLLHWTNTPSEQERYDPKSKTFHPQPYNVSLILPYEHMTNPHQGPILLQRLVHELHQANIPVLTTASTTDTDVAVAAAKRTRITGEVDAATKATTATMEEEHHHHHQQQQWSSCLWQHVVQNKDSKTRRKDRSYKPGFTRRQQTTMLAMLDDLIQLFTTTSTTRHITTPRPELVALLHQYRTDISTNLRIDDE
jgi:hypothetical protein